MHADVFNEGAPRTLPAPFDESLDLLLIALADDLDRAVRQVSHRARKAQLVSLPLCVVAVKNALDNSRYYYSRPSYH